MGINLLWLVPDGVGGSEQSTLATIRGLIELAPSDVDLRLFVVPGFAAAYPDVAAALPTEVATISGGSRIRRIVAESTWLAQRAGSLDLVHHAGGTVPARRTAPCVLTLHDLQPLQARATHSASKRAYLGRAVPAAVRAARRVAVPSQFVRGTAIDLLDAPADKLVVIPHAVPTRPPPTARDVLTARYGLSSGPMVLYAAVTYPHKDHRTLLDAVARTRADHPELTLVLPGGAGDAEADVQHAIDTDPRLTGAVRRLGRIPEADVAGLLEVATVVAVPSRYEGFGLPALEGMAAGAPVIAAAATSLPEVVGDAGLLVPPGDVEAWANALGGLLDDADARARLAQAGRARAAAFTPAANAAGFLDLYRQALSAG